MIKRRYEELKNLAESNDPKELIKNLSFKQGLLLARDFLNNEPWDEELQIYSKNLLENLRRKYLDCWNSNLRI